jgi:hypothetical protein
MGEAKNYRLILPRFSLGSREALDWETVSTVSSVRHQKSIGVLTSSCFFV